MSDEGLDLSRREFMAVGAITLTSIGDGPALQQVAVPTDLQETAKEQGFVAAPHLLGALEARPAAGDGFFDDKTGVYVYQTDGSGSGDGEKYWLAVENGAVISGWNEFPMPIPTNQLDEVATERSISFFNHTFARPEAPDTKNWEFTGADITKFNSEVELAATTTLQTTQRGNYPPGGPATPGVAFRLTGAPTAGEGLAGYFDANNGGGVGEDTTDSFVYLRKGGTEKRVHRTDWNGHVPDSRVWVNNRPVITRLPHLFYGGGDFEIKALIHEEAGSMLRTLHTFTPTNVDDTFADGPPFDQPNLPARFESDSLSGGNLRANACHYQFALSESENRVNGEHFGPITVGTSGWTELLTWRKRDTWEMVNVKPLKITAAATTNPVRLQLQLGPSTSSVTTSLPTDTSSSETAVEIVDGTITDDGERRWVGYVPAGQGQQSDALTAEGLTFNLPADRPVALFGQAVGGDAEVNGAVAWEEFF